MDKTRRERSLRRWGLTGRLMGPESIDFPHAPEQERSLVSQIPFRLVVQIVSQAASAYRRGSVAVLGCRPRADAVV